MGELIRTTRNTFDLIEAKLASEPEVLERLKSRAKILAAEVRFTVDPGTPDALALAKVLQGHNETGRTATALDRILATCSGQLVVASAPTASPARVTLDTTNAPAQMLAPFKKALDDERTQLEAMLANVPAGTPEAALKAVRDRLAEITKTAPSLVVEVTTTPATTPASTPAPKEKDMTTKEPTQPKPEAAKPADDGFKPQEFVPWRDLVGDLADKVGIEVSKAKKKAKKAEDE